MKIEIDSDSGFCAGVVNAIRLAELSLSTHGSVSSLGDIVHNRLEMERLEKLGLKTIGHGGLTGAKTVLVRAHVEPPSTYKAAAASGVEIIDATCPVVAALQRTVAAAHTQMTGEGGQVVILGKRGHAEVVGLTGQAEGGAPVIVVESEADLDTVDFSRPVYLLSQTTQSLGLFGRVSSLVQQRATSKVTVHDTICRAVANRENRIGKFAARHDVAVFVSGRKSSNGRLLFEACRTANPHSYMVEDETELRPEWFSGACSVGVCGATSTPKWTMEQVAQTIQLIITNS